MEDMDYEKIFVHTVTFYDVGREWVRHAYANSTTADRGPGCSRDGDAITSDRGSANGGSNGDRRTDITTADCSVDANR